MHERFDHGTCPCKSYDRSAAMLKDLSNFMGSNAISGGVPVFRGPGISPGPVGLARGVAGGQLSCW